MSEEWPRGLIAAVAPRKRLPDAHSLAVLDESGQEINKENPLITEHDGRTGEAILRSLTLVNKSEHYYYKDIRLSVNSVFPVTARIIVPDALTHTGRPEYFERDDVFPFNLQLSVNPGTPMQTVRGVNIIVSGTRCLSFSGETENQV